jgi:hypothetical protein
MPEGLVFISPDGLTTDLKALPGVRALGDRGLEMPAFRFIEDDIPSQDGARLREVKTLPRDVTLPFYLEQDDEAALRMFLRTLARRFTPTRGDGRLRHTTLDGATRELVCRYAEGLQGSRVTGDAGVLWRRGALVFRAHDPFWYDAQPTSITYTTSAPQPFLGDPFLPLKLTSDTVIGEQTVSNDGDVLAWPVWTIHGPASSVRLTNVTTGQVIDLPIALTATQSVVIDTRPFRKTVRRDDGTNLYGSLTDSSALWALPEGASNVRAELPGATSATYVTLVYARRWLSP